jgi:Type II secretion system (T2SS), protein E, N-terminal domain
MTGDDPTAEPDVGLDTGLDDEACAPAHPLELALRYGMRFSGLREVELDARLLLYLPLEICERETVLPLSINEELLHVASASPDPDLETVHERFPELKIELVFAPVERIGALCDELKAAL